MFTALQRRLLRIGSLLAICAGMLSLITVTPADANTSARYVVSVTAIRAVDESGPDWAGSDEVYGGFQAIDPRNSKTIAAFRTQFFTSFDTGNIKYPDYDKRCFPPRQILAFHSGRASFWDARGGDRWTCDATATVTAGINAPFTVQARLYDEEGCSLFADCAIERNEVLGAWLNGDQSLGLGSLSFSAAGLAADLPTVNSLRTYEITHKGSGAHYKSQLTIQRVG